MNVTPLKVGMCFYTPSSQSALPALEKLLAAADDDLRARIAALAPYERSHLNRVLQALAAENADIDWSELAAELREGDDLEMLTTEAAPPSAGEPFIMPPHALIIDTETAAPLTPQMAGFEDWRPEGQALLLLRAVLCAWDEHEYIPQREYLVYPDELPASGLQAVHDGMRARLLGEDYETEDPPRLPLHLLALSEFRQKLDKLLLNERQSAYLVGFNLAFDLSRLALDFKEARRAMKGGWSIGLFADLKDPDQPNPFKPRLSFRRLDNTKSFYRWGSQTLPNKKDKGGGLQRDKQGKVRYASRKEQMFIDVRTLLVALTGEKHTLRSAAQNYLPPEQWKAEIGEYGVITPELIAYQRQDCHTTLALFNKLLAEWRQLSISTPPHALYSSASIAKAYLRDAGIKPRLVLQPDFSPEILGYAMSAYYGGRVDALLRRVSIPCVHGDFMSMYPTVMTLMNSGELTRAARIEVVECADEAQQFLNNITHDSVFKPETWRHEHMNMLVLVKPQGDILPVRGCFDQQTPNIGLVPYWADAQWYMMPDLVASKLLLDEYARQLQAGRPVRKQPAPARAALRQILRWPSDLLRRLRKNQATPEVLRAYKFVPVGLQSDLKPVMLRGVVPVDPRTDDLIRVAVEERQRIKKGVGPYSEWPAVQRDSTQLVLKLIANAGGYGVFAERNRDDFSRKQSYKVYSDRKISIAQEWRERPGTHFFAPLAAAITAAARLMLAALEVEVMRRGGTYVCGDTDSMYIAADQTAREMAVRGIGADGAAIEQSIWLLSWPEVDEIADRFAALNPYPAIPGSIFKLEDDNYNQAGEQRRLWCYAVSSKRYCLQNDAGELVDCMESSLADYWLPPLSAVQIRAEIERRARMGELCFSDKNRQNEIEHRFENSLPLLSAAEIEQVVEQALSGSSLLAPPITATDVFIKDVWEFACGHDRRAFDRWQAFPVIQQRAVSTTHTCRQFDRLNAARPLRDQMKPGNFYLRASYYGDPQADGKRKWTTIIAPFEPEKDFLEMGWFYADNGKLVADVNRENFNTLYKAVRDYDFHPEAAYAGPDGLPCAIFTRGLLMRRPVSCASRFYIGKQTPQLDELWDVREEQPAVSTLHDPDSDSLPALLNILRDMKTADVAERFQIAPRTVQRWLAGTRQVDSPAALRALVIEYAQDVTGRVGHDALRAYPAARVVILQAEQELTRRLADWQVARRYDCSLRNAQYVRAGKPRPFYEVLAARRNGR